MKVILRESYENLGRTGDEVDVKPGFARNYLVPQGIAYPANAFYRRRFLAEREQLLRKDEERRARAASVAEKGEGAEVEFKVRVSERGQMFGAVTNANIAEALEEKGIHVDRRKIVLPAPIKNLGEYDITVRPHGDVEFNVHVTVKPESTTTVLRELSIRELVEGVDEEAEAAAAAAEAEAAEKAQAEADQAAEQGETPAEGDSSEGVEVVEMVEARPATEEDESGEDKSEDEKSAQ